jgi:hypothetical protein
VESKPKPVCARCGQPPIKVQGTEPLVDGLCWFCRKLRMGKP